MFSDYATPHITLMGKRKVERNDYIAYDYI